MNYRDPLRFHTLEQTGAWANRSDIAPWRYELGITSRRHDGALLIRRQVTDVDDVILALGLARVNVDEGLPEILSALTHALCHDFALLYHVPVQQVLLDDQEF